MARNVTTQPQPTHEPEAKAAATAKAQPAGKVIPLSEQEEQRQSVDLARKATVRQEAQQKLAFAHDLEAEGEEKQAEATEAKGEAALLLYQAQADGQMNAEEINSLLGNVWGYKQSEAQKAKGEYSKTPAGAGEGVRKRIVRLVAAYEFANELSDGGKFFEPLKPADVAAVLNDLHNPDTETTVWKAYNDLGEMRRKAMEGSRPDLAFDPVRIAGIAARLGEAIEASALMLANSPDLVKAYTTLKRNFRIADERAAVIVAEREAEAKAAE